LSFRLANGWAQTRSFLYQNLSLQARVRDESQLAPHPTLYIIGWKMHADHVRSFHISALDYHDA